MNSNVKILIADDEERWRRLVGDSLRNEGYKVVDTGLTPSVEGAMYGELTSVNGPVDGLDPEEKILLVCNKGKRAYLLQNRLKYYGYKNTRVLEGGSTFTEVEASGTEL